MSIEPERPVEKLLKSYAKQRREQAGDPPPLHPAMRRQLLSEAAKRYGRRQDTTSRWLALKGFWPRLAIGAATMAVLIVSAAIWTSADRSKNKAPEVQMAKNEGLRSTGSALRLDQSPEKRSAVEATKKDSSIANAVPAVPSLVETVTNLPAPSVVAEVKIKSEAQPKPGREEEASVVALASRSRDSDAARPVPASALADKETKSMLAGGAVRSANPTADSLAVATPPGVSVASERAANTEYREQRTTQQQASAMQNSTLNQLFSNRVQGGGQLPPAGVMAQFRVEQEGQVLWIIDNDGSVYNGSLELADSDSPAAPAVATARQTLQRAKAPEPVQNVPQQAQNFRVEVSGTNITLNQKVVFTGNLMGNNISLTSNFQNQATSVQNLKLQQQVMSLFRLSGKARVGSGPDLPVEAVPLQ